MAIATVIAQYFYLYLYYFIKSRRIYATYFEKNRDLNKDKVKVILKLGLPAGLQGIIFSISNVLIQSSINSFGQLVIAR